MDSAPKRRARFRKGVTPPPLEPPVKLTWFQEYDLRQAERKRRQEERLRNRQPLPELGDIRARFVEATLRRFALSDPSFWEDSTSRFFCYRSDFLKSIRLSDHVDSFDQIIATCRKAEFPLFKYGKVEVSISGPQETEARAGVSICYRLGQTAEWTDAIGELCSHLGIPVASSLPSKNAQMLIDFAATVPPGVCETFPKSNHAKWSFSDCDDAVREAQMIDPRLYHEGKTLAESKIRVLSGPLSLLVLPSLGGQLDLPSQANKADCDAASRRIEQIVEEEYREGRLIDGWLVLVRTMSRKQALKSFGHLAPYNLAGVTSKLHPTGMDTWWDFPRSGGNWIVAVRPQDGTRWSEVVKAIQEKVNEVASSEKYRLSEEAAALFDWLRRLAREQLEWSLSPELTDDVLQTEIGIKNPWDSENSFLFFRLLTEEISRQTPFVAVAHPWKRYSTISTRIEFRPKPHRENIRNE